MRKGPSISELRLSARKVGMLYPALLDREGRVIDGKHRLRACADWPKIKLDHIRSEKDILLARLISNACRRTITQSEKTQALERLGAIYLSEGEKKGRLAQRIAEETGMSYRWVMKYLPDRLKARPGSGGPKCLSFMETKESEISPPDRQKTDFRECTTIRLGRLFSMDQGRPLIAKIYSNANFVSLTLEKRIYEDFERLGETFGISAETIMGNAMLLLLKEIQKILTQSAGTRLPRAEPQSTNL